MKHMTKRALSFLMALVLCLSLLPLGGIQAQAATVNYVYNGQYLYNWGSRGTVATFMSPNALAFYEDNNVSLDSLANLSGSASTGSVPSSALYQTLKTLMTNNHSYKTSYDATKSLYKYTDCQNSGGKISSFYSGNAIGPEWGQGSWNREHTWPNSKGLGGQDENDIMMLRPTSTSENSSRGNTVYGKSSGYYNPNGESGGNYNLHGDVARIMLYTYVRWGNTSYMWGKSGVMESRDVLLEWMEEDPVDTWELGRNDAVEAITGTRNVFVDYPELAFVMFGSEIPANYTSPSGGVSNSVTYNITATSNNTAWGTVAVAGRTITATPATGYEVSGYDLLGGTATVNRTGNQFIVAPSTDVSIRINFAQKVALPTVSQLQTGDQVVIYAPAYNKALTSETMATHYLAGVDITESNGAITGYGSTALWTVTANTDGTYSFSYGSQKLGMADEYSSMKLGEAHDKWALVALGDGLYKVQNTARGNYMEWYSSKDNWSTYTSASDSQFHISFYVVGKGIYDGASSAPETPDEPDQPVTPPVTPETSASLKNGAQVVIYAPAYNKALTATTIASYYLAGMDITVSGGAVTGYDNTAIWTVTANTDGTYSFSNGGQKLGIAAEKNSMNLGLVNDQWQLIALGGSLYQVKNTARGNYMEWYASKDNWSTYTNPSDDQFKLSFYVIGEGILTEGAQPEQPPVTPDLPVTPPVTPDEPITPPASGDGVLELTVNSLAIPSDTYYTGAATVEGIALDLTQIGNYGNGIQMRDKEGKTSVLFNTTALPGKITQIQLTFSANMSTYDNADAVIFSFGDAQNNLTYTTKLSTTAGEKSYTITPVGDFSFFKIEHDLGFSMYWDSIKICYEEESQEPEPPVEIEKLTAPVVKKDGQKLTWNDVEHADYYEIYRATSKSGKYTLVANQPFTYYEDITVAAKTYYYKVKAVYEADETKNSELSKYISLARKCDAPLADTEHAASGKPIVYWDKVIGASKYTVYRATSETGKYSKLGTTSKLSYTDSKAKAGMTYFYKVIANASSSKYNSAYSNVVSCDVICGTPSVSVKIDAATGKPSLSWKKVDGAASYAIYRDGQLLTTVTAVTYADASAAIDTQYSYAVQALGKTESLNGNLSKEFTATSGIAKPAVKGSIDAATGKPVITWQAVEGAVKYEIYRSTKSSKSYKLLTTVEAPGYIDETVSTGKTYYYKVKAIGQVSKSADSSYVKLTGKCAATEVFVELHETSGKPVISWYKVSGAKKYTVYRATSETGKYTKLGTTTKLSYTDTKAVPGTRYFYKVVVNGSSSSYNSAYSNIVSVVGYAAAPQVTLKNDSKGKPVVSWKKVSEAEKYMVVYVDVTTASENDITEEFILENLQYVEVSKKKTSVTLTQAQTGRVYLVFVVAVPKNEDYSGVSLPGYVTSTCVAPKISGKYVENCNYISWKAVDGAEYYAVYRSTKKSSGYELVGYTGEAGWADLDTTKGKTYYYKVTALTEYTQSAMSNYVKLKAK